VKLNTSCLDIYFNFIKIRCLDCGLFFVFVLLYKFKFTTYFSRACESEGACGLFLPGGPLRFEYIYVK
jgi:hypothetical protein